MSETVVQLQPLDEHNQKLQSNVHPTDWSNPAPKSQHYYVADPNVEQVVCCCGPNQHCGDQVENHSCGVRGVRLAAGLAASDANRRLSENAA